MSKILIFGPGWLGHKMAKYLSAELVPTDITDKAAVNAILDEKKPAVVINTAGQTGQPNIDWCEDHKIETIESNTTGPLVLLKACFDRDIRLVHFSSGCIFDGASPKMGGFTEDDTPKPVSFYGQSKAAADKVLKLFPVLIVRLRMPIDKIPGPRNLITKLAHYPKIIDVENSITVIDDLLKAVAALIEKNAVGIYNVTNPGTVKHRDIMAWYKKIVDPSCVYTMVPATEITKLTKAGRSNCILNTTKLKKAGIHLRPAADAIVAALIEYKKHFQKK